KRTRRPSAVWTRSLARGSCGSAFVSTSVRRERGARTRCLAPRSFSRGEHVSHLRGLLPALLAAVAADPGRVAVDAGRGHALGLAAAPVTIVEFADFQCPYCARLAPTLKRVKTAYGDR